MFSRETSAHHSIIGFEINRLYVVILRRGILLSLQYIVITRKSSTAEQQRATLFSTGRRGEARGPVNCR